MFSREIILTSDGSSSLYIPEWGESYHSRHGAIQEAFHVFIRNGLDLSVSEKINILEMGFGTGLNALITFQQSQIKGLEIHYTGLEKFPISNEEFQQLNYVNELHRLQPDFEPGVLEPVYEKLVSADWEKEIQIGKNFKLHKIQADFLEFNYPESQFDLVYFDAFGARVQPELWTEELFEKLYRSMTPGGVFTTYSAKGSVRRALVSVGFEVRKRPGPPGKREMLTAQK